MKKLSKLNHSFSKMSRSSAAFNLSKKFEWMSRRIRYIDDAESIQKWIAAMEAIFNLIQLAATLSEEYADGWRPNTRHAQNLKLPSKSEKVVTSALSNTAGDEHMNADVNWNEARPGAPLQFNRRLSSSNEMTLAKVTISHTAFKNREPDLSRIIASSADEELNEELDVDMNAVKTSPPRPMSAVKISVNKQNKKARLMPPQVELDSTSNEASSTEDMNDNRVIDPQISRSLSQLLRKRLEEADVPLNHWQAKGGERLRSLFEAIINDLNLERNLLLGNDMQTFLLKELFSIYQT